MVGSVSIDFLRPKFGFARTKNDVISISMNKYNYTNMYIIEKTISCSFILCSDITPLLKSYEKSCRSLRSIVKIENNLNGDLQHFALEDDKIPSEGLSSTRDYFILHKI